MSDKDEIERLAARADALRAAISRAQMELKSASAEERAISERVDELRSAATAPAAAPLPPQPPQSKSDEATVIQPRLARREQWKVAMAGAAAATFLATIGISVYLAVTPKQVVVVAPLAPLVAPTLVATQEAPAPVGTNCVENNNSNPPTSPTTVTTNALPPPPAPPTLTRRPRRPGTANNNSGDDINELLAAGLTDDAVAAGPPTPPTTTAAPPPPSKLGALTVVCMPKSDEIIDNGVSLGPGHVFNRPRPAGAHVLSLRTPNGVRKTIRVEIAPDQTREVRVSMDSGTPVTASQRSANCTPPFVIDEQGRRRYKAECLSRDRGFDPSIDRQ